jgi:hypothetical protein
VTRLVCAVLVVFSLSVAPARGQDADPPARSGRWERPPLALSIGLNRGVQKIYVRIDAKTGERPLCAVEFRKTGSAADLAEETFLPQVTPERMSFAGAADIEAEGNVWTQMKWVTDGGGRTAIVCHPIRAIGPRHLEYFKKYGYDVTAERLPFALLILQDKTDGPALSFPLRDLAAYTDPKRALLQDDVPFEKGAGLLDVVSYLTERLHGADAARKLQIIARLERFDTELLTSAVPAMLAARDDPDARVAHAAQRLCRLHAFFSLQEVEAACAQLAATDLESVRRAVFLLRDMGPKTRREAYPALERMLVRADLPPDVASAGKNLLEKLAKIDPVTLRPMAEKTPASRPASKPTGAER